MTLRFIDDPESRMLYAHHGENEMMTTFINVRSNVIAMMCIYIALPHLYHFNTSLAPFQCKYACMCS